MSDDGLSPGASAAAHALAGMTGSCAAMTLLYPLDSIRSILQTMTESEADGLSSAGLILRLVREDGLGGALAKLYGGIEATMGTLAASQAIYFFAYETLKSAWRGKGTKPPSALETLALAYAAGVINATLTSPLWTAAKRVQLARMASRAAASDSFPATGRPLPAERPSLTLPRAVAPASTSLGGMVMRIVAEEGVGGLFRSLPVSLVLCANPAIQFFVYERLRGSLTGGQSRSLSAVEGFAAGALSKAVATVLTFPLQVVQTRMQAGVDAVDGAGSDSDSDSDDDAKAGAGGPGPARGGALAPRRAGAGIWPALASLLREGGVAALFRGMGPKLLQTVLNAAIMFAVYERLLGGSRLLVFLALARLSRDSE